jgi:hypothetical protein
MKLSYNYIQVLLFCSLLISCKKDDLYTSSDVKVNEFMSSNSETACDQNGEYDDWIELYNNGNVAIDLSGYYLTDNHNDFKKWEFPAGTKIAANGYLIVWADEDVTQTGLHTNFKLSADGEEVMLITPKLKIADYITFGSQSSELSYARIPNGTGIFSWQKPTFNSLNAQSQ